jgi:hypothetical protein
MNLVPTTRYLEAAEGLVEMNPFGYRRLAFMSTEDPSAIEDMVASNLSDTWRWLWWEVPRINSNGPDQLVELNMKRGELTFIWWLQLFIALEADGWVGTRGSNWNRLLDELRCVWVPKCQNVYVEVGDDVSWKGPHGPWKSQGWCVALAFSPALPFQPLSLHPSFFLLFVFNFLHPFSPFPPQVFVVIQSILAYYYYSILFLRQGAFFPFFFFRKTRPGVYLELHPTRHEVS